jgi:hypothetical protein
MQCGGAKRKNCVWILEFSFIISLLVSSGLGPSVCGVLELWRSSDSLILRAIFHTLILIGHSLLKFVPCYYRIIRMTSKFETSISDTSVPYRNCHTYL